MSRRIPLHAQRKMHRSRCDMPSSRVGTSGVVRAVVQMPKPRRQNDRGASNDARIESAFYSLAIREDLQRIVPLDVPCATTGHRKTVRSLWLTVYATAPRCKQKAATGESVLFDPTGGAVHSREDRAMRAVDGGALLQTFFFGISGRCMMKTLETLVDANGALDQRTSACMAFFASALRDETNRFFQLKTVMTDEDAKRVANAGAAQKALSTMRAFAASLTPLIHDNGGVWEMLGSTVSLSTP